MAKQFDEKQKILYILKILSEETDELHKITTADLIKKLAEYDIKAERKSVYRDLDTLADFGFDINRGRCGCYLGNRTFELAELKLLVDAVQASKFISEKKSNDIIKKLSGLTSCYNSSELKRGVFVSDRPKNQENSVIYTIDGLHSAINSNHIVKFKYTEWTPEKKKQPRHNGKLYEVSPWGLLWDDEYYYLIAYDQQFGGIKHFRVDKIAQLQETNIPRLGYENYSKLDLGQYSKKVFGMFGGTDDTVTLEIPANLIGVIFDRFGTDMTVFEEKNGNYSVAVPVKVSNNFLSWIIQFNGKMKIVSPPQVKEQLEELINNVKESLK